MQFPRCASLIIHVLKHDTQYGSAGTTNSVTMAAKLDIYPLLQIEDLFAFLNGGTSFTMLDLAHTYQQILLENESMDLVAINAHKGLYPYTGLPFGVTSVPSIFQRIIESTLRDTLQVSVHINDINDGYCRRIAIWSKY